MMIEPPWMELLSALAAIVMIDLVLAGDNAIVIALAARRLPAALRRRAIVWGTVAAIAVRAAMTLAIVWLLALPGLMLAGGVLLIWIAYRLLIEPHDGAHSHDIVAPGGFWGAMRTIVIADGVMGLDNMLAVAGAARGQMALVVLGLLISIPIMVWGSALVLKGIERFPLILQLGGTVLAWTAAGMIAREPMIADALARVPGATVALYAVLTLGVPGLAWLRARPSTRTRELPASRVPGHCADAGTEPPRRTAVNLLIPVDGSRETLRAVDHAIRQSRLNPGLGVTLLGVQPALTRHAARWLDPVESRRIRQADARRRLHSAEERLRAAGVDFTTEVVFGPVADTIAASALRLRADRVLLGIRRKPAWMRALLPSVTQRLIAEARVPVEVIAHGQPTPWQRFGLPAGVGLGLTAWVLAE